MSRPEWSLNAGISTCVRFKKPGVSTLSARFVLEPAELDDIRTALQSAPSVDRQYHIELIDRSGEVRAWVDKTVYIRLLEADIGAASPQ